MPIEIQCPACGKRLRAPDSQAGRAGRCPSCKTDFLIPALDERPPAIEASPPARGAASHPGAPATMPPPRERRGELPIGAGIPDFYAPKNPPAVDDLPPVRQETAQRQEPTYHLPPEPAAGGEVTNQGSVGLEGRHWTVLRAALRLSELALMAGWISSALIGLGMLLFALLVTFANSPSVFGIKFISVTMIWGAAGLAVAWAGIVSSWIVCLLGWPHVESRRWLWGAAAAVGVSLAVVVLFISFQIFEAPSYAAQSSGPLGGTTVIIVLAGLALAAALVLFNFFLAMIDVLVGQQLRGNSAILYAAVVGGLTVWCLVLDLAIQPTSVASAWLMVISNCGLLIAEYVWLWLKNRFVSRRLREMGV
jgi:hypothetical protein